MLDHETNQYLCNVQPGAPMHDLLKRYWIPAGLSADVPEPDSEPVRITLLAQNYVMFRDTSGDVGILDDHCCHRGASLSLGRVEHGGIRCIYHGWKFAVDGTVLETPNAGHAGAARSFRQPAYPVRERGGLVWVYLGPPDRQPTLPHHPYFDVPESCRYIGTPLINCNFVQVLEGAIDSAHLGILHADVHSRGAVSSVDQAPITGQVRGQFVNAVAPRIEIEDTPWGFRYAALRDLKDEHGRAVTQARVTAFFLPFCSNVTDEGSILMAVPVSNEWTIHYHIFWKPPGHGAEIRLQEMITFLGWKDEALQARERARRTGSIAGTVSAGNGYRQDRAGMRRRETFSGLANVVVEDMAVTESMGAISDRSIEHLVASDAAVARARTALVRNARRVAGGEDPGGWNLTQAPAGGQGFVSPDTAWQSWFST